MFRTYSTGGWIDDAPYQKGQRAVQRLQPALFRHPAFGFSATTLRMNAPPFLLIKKLRR